jgi:hypothetical protein
VFIGYSRDSSEHDERVLELVQRLRAAGIDAWLDRFEPAPPQGWPRWMRDQIAGADFVVLVCTPNFRRMFEGEGPGRNDNWFGLLMTQQLYDGQLDLERVVPVSFDAGDDASVPASVRGATRHVMPHEYPQLVAQLTKRLAVVPVSLGAAPLHAGMSEPLTLADELTLLHERRKHLTRLGEDTSEFNQAILELRRRLREGPNLAAGEIVGNRYALSEKLGHGGFASVWKAWDDQSGSFVALKILHAQWADDRSRVERFVRGAKKMAELRHQGLVPVIAGPSVDEHYHFFVMPFFAGGDLARVRSQGRMEVERAFAALADALAGLAHVHDAGLVHRDLKPSNVLLDERGRGYLADFDLVHATNTTAGTRSGAAMGTFAYGAPEQHVDAAKVDARVMGQRPNGCTGCEPHQPVRWVSWNDAILFFNALTRHENYKRPAAEEFSICYDEQTGAWDRGCTGYRLPTEAEWEFVARAGTTTAWSFGSDVDDSCLYANTSTEACGDGFQLPAPVEVEYLRANPWGLHGIHGNVWEWVYDVYGDYGEAVIDPENANDIDANTDSDIDAIRVTRGGSFYFPPELARSASRSKSYPWALNPDLGLRCARGARSLFLLDFWLATRRGAARRD